MRIQLVLDDGDDRERADDDLRYLLDELSQADVAGIEPVPTGPAPAGTKGGGAVEWGAAVIALGGSGATLPVFVALVRDWLLRRGSGTIRLKIGSDELELTQAPVAVQQRVLDEFLSRHLD